MEEILYLYSDCLRLYWPITWWEPALPCAASEFIMLNRGRREAGGTHAYCRYLYLHWMCWYFLLLFMENFQRKLEENIINMYVGLKINVYRSVKLILIICFIHVWSFFGKWMGNKCFRLNKPAGREQSVHLGILEATDLTGFCSTGTRGNPEQTGQRSSWLTCLQGSPNNS